MNRKKILYNSLFWAGLYILWVLVFQKRTFVFSRTVTVQFCYLLFIAANYYFNIYFTIPLFLYKKKYVAFGFLLIAGIIVASILRVPLATYLSEHYFAPGHIAPKPSQLFFDSLINIFLWVISLVAAKLILDRIRLQKYVEAIERDKIKNELDFLKAQFNPHFLFNSINSIYGNIDKRNSTAREMLLTFSEMLRYQLYDCNTNAISLEKEINYVRNYVALQQTRKPENLSIQLDVCENVSGVMIAPLLFTAFIENAFKYVSHHENDLNEVRISIMKENSNIVFKTFNTKENLNGHATAKHSGIGIANVKRRLELLYPQKHELRIYSFANSFEAILKLHV